MVSKDQAMGLIRHVLTIAGGALSSYGVLDETMVATLVGALVTIAGVVWSMKAPEKQKGSIV